MNVYFGLFIIIILINLLPSQNKQIANAKLVFSFILIFIYAAIRTDHGLDYSSYENMFNNIKNYFGTIYYNSTTEIGYVLLNKIMPSHRILLVVLSVFTCYTYYWLFRNYVPPKFYWFAFALMAIMGNTLLFFQLSGLRNAIAINIMTLATPLIIKRKFIPYILLTVLAFTFHRSAILIMPIPYFIATPFEFKRKNILIWSITCIVLMVFSTSRLAEIISPFINTYFNKYSTYIEHAIEYEFSAKSTILLIIFVVTFLFLSFTVLSQVNLNNTEIVIFKLSLLFIVSPIFGALNIRMSQYFAPYFLLSGVIVMNRVKKPVLKNAYLGAMIIYLLYAFFIDFMGKPNFPYEIYHTIFDY